jgi:hypothetical protein
MRKLLLAVALLPAAAYADTIDLQGPLGSSTVNAVQTYTHIPNDAGLTVDYQNWYGQGRLTLTAQDGTVVACSSVTSATNLNCQQAILQADGTTVMAAAGWAIVSLVQTSHVVCVCQGRGQHRTTYWTLQSGTIERQ